MPKRREAGFRRIFAAPEGQLVMALDYSQIELRAVAELISDWFGTDSILRQSFRCWRRRSHRYSDVDDGQM
jgi:DNA polymerase I-like protein with 3'-5' exonuclease and polymerase domains